MYMVIFANMNEFSLIADSEKVLFIFTLNVTFRFKYLFTCAFHMHSRQKILTEYVRK